MTPDLPAARFTGGCLCGALRYEAMEAPAAMGHCYCRDCQRASGSGFSPFMSFAAGTIRFSGASRAFVCLSARGGPATRNFCPLCCSLVFGGERDLSRSFTVYAGTLDEPALFQPTMAIFDSQRPPWALLPPGITQVFARMPGMDPEG